jgi:hypothetical protein
MLSAYAPVVCTLTDAREVFSNATGAIDDHRLDWLMYTNWVRLDM